MYICARSNQGPVDGRGAVGLAISDNLLHWSLLPPVCAPGDFSQMEVPQVIWTGERYYLLFSITKDCFSIKYLAKSGKAEKELNWGAYAFVSDGLTGGFDLDSEEGILADPKGTFYAAKMVRNPAGKWVCLATQQWNEDGTYRGSLSDPMPVSFNDRGQITVTPEPII